MVTSPMITPSKVIRSDGSRSERELKKRSAAPAGKSEEAVIAF
jgi:hypothetical protein